jgi:hypothetical protein
VGEVPAAQSGGVSSLGRLFGNDFPDRLWGFDPSHPLPTQAAFQQPGDFFPILLAVRAA